MKQILITLGIVLFVVLAILVMKPMSFGTGTTNLIFAGAPTTQSSVVASSTVSLVLAGNGGRQYVEITNLGTSTVYLWEQSTSTGVAALKAFPVITNAKYTLGDPYLYVGNIWAITASGTSTLTVVER
jgi:hypothetical protein